MLEFVKTNLLASRFARIFFFPQVKLFREWSSKWPEEHKLKLKEKVCELDTVFGEKLNTEILNGYSNGNGLDSGSSSPVEQPPIAAIQNEAIVA